MTPKPDDLGTGWDRRR